MLAYLQSVSQILVWKSVLCAICKVKIYWLNDKIVGVVLYYKLGYYFDEKLCQSKDYSK